MEQAERQRAANAADSPDTQQATAAWEAVYAATSKLLALARQCSMRAEALEVGTWVGEGGLSAVLLRHDM